MLDARRGRLPARFAGTPGRAVYFGDSTHAAGPLRDLFNAFLLGLVEGATEFIPVSSTGHLIIATDWLGYRSDDARLIAFNIFIQLGAILAVVWVYRAKIASVLKRLPSDPAAQRFAAALAVAFVPAAILGFLFDDAIEAFLFNPVTVAAALVVGGVAILLVERIAARGLPVVDDAEGVDPARALKIGLAQCLALVPGVSRSGATIMGGYALGLSRVAATEFSFFLAIPVMVAATGYKLLKEADALTGADIPFFAVGFVTAFVSALVVIRFLVRYVSRHSFAGFAWYRIVFGLVLLALYLGGYMG